MPVAFRQRSSSDDRWRNAPGVFRKASEVFLIIFRSLPIFTDISRKLPKSVIPLFTLMCTCTSKTGSESTCLYQSHFIFYGYFNHRHVHAFQTWCDLTIRLMFSFLSMRGSFVFLLTDECFCARINKVCHLVESLLYIFALAILKIGFQAQFAISVMHALYIMQICQCFIYFNHLSVMPVSRIIDSRHVYVYLIISKQKYN